MPQTKPSSILKAPSPGAGHDHAAPGVDARQRADLGAAAGRPLVLIEEHLTDTPPSFRASSLLKGWKFPADWEGPSPENPLCPVLKIQSFKVGGYEASIRFLDLPRIGRAAEFGGRRGRREVPSEVDQVHAMKAAQRAKRRVRHLTKNMGADHLMTLTRRESDPETYWGPEEWAKAWDRLRRVLVRAIGDFPYVAVLERHKKGNFHLHVAWVGKINLNLVRPAWWSILGGRGQGNVDAQYIKVRTGLARSDKVAKYISKYCSKGFEEGARFNKKRFWGSRQEMPEVRRYVLRSRTADDALLEVRGMLGFELGRLCDSKGHFFAFPDGSGFWFGYVPELHSTPPPF